MKYYDIFGHSSALTEASFQKMYQDLREEYSIVLIIVNTPN